MLSARFAQAPGPQQKQSHYFFKPLNGSGKVNLHKKGFWAGKAPDN
jgi:hypothetical protein